MKMQTAAMDFEVITYLAVRPSFAYAKLVAALTAY